MLLHRMVPMVLVSFLPFCKNLGNLQEFSGRMVYPPSPTPTPGYAYGTPKKTVKSEQTT